MLGEPITAERACQIGLANEVLPVGQLRDRADEVARRLASGPAFAYATTKSLLTRELDMPLGAAIELESISQALMMQSDDFEEFYAAWSAGRRPEWTGR